MTFFSGFAVYFIIWWITLFLVLPYGVRSQAESGEEMVPGTEPGAPVEHKLGIKLLVNTVLAGVVFGAWVIARQYFGITLEPLTNLLVDF